MGRGETKRDRVNETFIHLHIDIEVYDTEMERGLDKEEERGHLLGQLHGTINGRPLQTCHGHFNVSA